MGESTAVDAGKDRSIYLAPLPLIGGEEGQGGEGGSIPSDLSDR